MFFGLMAVCSSLAQGNVCIFGLIFKMFHGAKSVHLWLNTHFFGDPRYAHAVRPRIKLGLSSGQAANPYKHSIKVESKRLDYAWEISPNVFLGCVKCKRNGPVRQGPNIVHYSAADATSTHIIRCCPLAFHEGKTEHMVKFVWCDFVSPPLDKLEAAFIRRDPRLPANIRYCTVLV
jgi:hypothetical protein